MNAIKTLKGQILATLPKRHTKSSTRFVVDEDTDIVKSVEITIDVDVEKRPVIDVLALFSVCTSSKAFKTFNFVLGKANLNSMTIAIGLYNSMLPRQDVDYVYRDVRILQASYLDALERSHAEELRNFIVEACASEKTQPSQAVHPKVFVKARTEQIILRFEDISCLDSSLFAYCRQAMTCYKIVRWVVEPTSENTAHVNSFCMCIILQPMDKGQKRKRST